MERYVQYIHTHTNHTAGIAEAKHIPLPNAVKEVREKYGQHVKLDSILDGRYFGNLSSLLCTLHMSYI